MADESKPEVEELLDRLRAVTQKAEELAAEVARAIRADRRVALPAGAGTATNAAASKARRRSRDRRKVQDDEG